MPYLERTEPGTKIIAENWSIFEEVESKKYDLERGEWLGSFLDVGWSGHFQKNQRKLKREGKQYHQESWKTFWECLIPYIMA